MWALDSDSGLADEARTAGPTVRLTVEDVARIAAREAEGPTLESAQLSRGTVDCVDNITVPPA